MLHAKEIVHIKFKNTQCLGFYFGTDSELMMSDCLGDVPADPYNQREPVQQVNEVPRPRKIKQALKSYFQNQCHEQGLFNTDLEWLVTGMSIMGHREICYTAFVITDSVVSDNRLDAEAGWHQVDLSEEDTSGMSEDEKSKLVIKHIAKCASTAKINTSFEVQDSADVMSSTGLVSKLTFTIKPSSLMRQFNINETSINRAVDDIIGKIRHARNQEALEGVVGEASFGSQSGQNPQEAAGQAPFISQSVPVSQTCTDKASCSDQFVNTAPSDLPKSKLSPEMHPSASSSNDPLPVCLPKGMFSVKREMESRDEEDVSYRSSNKHQRY